MATREFSDTSREKMAGRGVAMPDGSYPIPDKDALRRAIASFGRAKDPAAVKRHIIKRARALGAVDMLPEDWGAKGSMAAQHSAQAADILEDLYCLIDCEADEPAHVAMLTSAADLVVKFLQSERAEIGQPGDMVEAAYAEKARILTPKSWVEVKAVGLTPKQLDSWLAGEISRRIMVVPFGGPLPGGKAGLDLDGEYFDEETDIYGPYPALRRTRDRLVDWHHDNDKGVPASVPSMKGAILGRITLDEGPSTLKADDGDYDGIAADFWANAGERRLALVRALQMRGAHIFGSTQAVVAGVRKADDGHIEQWPVYRHTLSTSPQNTFAVVPPLKALLAADLPDDVGIAALKAALVGLDNIVPSLRSRFTDAGPGLRQGGNGAGKAGRVLSRKNEALVAAIAEQAERLLAQLRKAVPAPDSTDEREPEA